MMPSAMTSPEWNQSSSWPLSSMICSEPTQTTSNASPTESMGSFLVGLSRFRKMLQVMKAAPKPTGMLM
jgi:hypothetical protein